jgi:LPXTG-motif cell wall-anchored protein
MHFQPSQHSYGDSDYGWWTAAAKARQRDRQRRKAGRDFSKYEECVQEGKGSKCEKYKEKGKKHLGKAKTKDDKVVAKGKKTKGLKDRTMQFKGARAGTLGMSEEEIAAAGLTAPQAGVRTRGAGGGMGVGRAAASGAGGGMPEGMDVPSDEELAMDTAETGGGGGGGGIILALVGLAVVGGGAFFFYKKKKAAE